MTHGSDLPGVEPWQGNLFCQLSLPIIIFQYLTVKGKTDTKQLLDEGFVISRIIKVEGYQPKTKAEADNPYLDMIIL